MGHPRFRLADRDASCWDECVIYVVAGTHAGVSIRSDMPPDRLALCGYDEFGVTWPVPEETVWRILVQQVT
jgi:hypothetical protein